MGGRMAAEEFIWIGCASQAACADGAEGGVGVIERIARGVGGWVRRLRGR
jgi:hypothetical protein